MVAGAVGADDRAKAGRSALAAIVVAVVAGFLVAAVLIAFTEPILGVMGADGVLRSEAATYIRIRALAAPAVLVVRACHGIFRGHQDTRTPLVVTMGINGINLVPLLIFGVGWGVAGAAWATLTAQWVGAVWFGVLLLYRRREELGLVFSSVALAEIRPFLTAGRDIVIRTVALLAVFTYATRVATRIGHPSATAVAAHQVAFQVWIFLALVVDALAIAAQALIGRFRGAGDQEQARQVADRLVVLGVVLGLALAAVLLAVSPWLPGWFTPDPAVAAAIDGIYWFLLAGIPLAAVVFVWDGVFLGAGDFAYLAMAMVGAGVIGVAMLALVLPMGWGLAGVWWAITVVMAVRLLTLAWRRADRTGPFRLPR